MKFTVIKEKRNEYGITQKELSKRANISNTTLNRLENGKLNTCSVGTLKVIADVLSIKLIDTLIDKEL